jgi:hypothetical protein
MENDYTSGFRFNSIIQTLSWWYFWSKSALKTSHIILYPLVFMALAISFNFP